MKKNYLLHTMACLIGLTAVFSAGACSLPFGPSDSQDSSISSSASGELENSGTEAKKTYTVTWANHDGSELKTDVLEEGEMPLYDGETPLKAATAQYTYVFEGWDKEISAVTGNVTYTAVFLETTNKYTITWKNHDGTVLATEDVEYGEVPEYKGENPTKADRGDYTYMFIGWDVAPVAVVGEATYVAEFEEKYADRDTIDKISYYPGWGGNTETANISVNTDKTGLTGEKSVQSILIEDFDITGYNDYCWQMGGYSGFEADVKIVLSDNVKDVAKTIPVHFYDEGGNTLNVVPVNAWTKVFSATGNWGMMLSFPALESTDGNKISAKIYLDNVRFHTAETIGTLNGYRFANNSELTQIAGGDTSASEEKGTWKIANPNIAPSGEETHHNHAVVIKTAVSDISDSNGFSFAVNAKTWNGNNHHYFYIIPKKDIEGLTAEKMDAYGQIQTTYEEKGLIRVESYEATNPNNESGYQIIHISKEDLTAAGYDITDLDKVVIAFRNSVWNTDASLGTTGWAAICSISFCDFKLY